MRIRIVTLVPLLLALSATSYAQNAPAPDAATSDGPTYVPCLDTWAINSSSVLLAKIVEVCSPSKCKSDNTVALRVERYLKGGPGTELTLQIDAPAEALKDWKHRKSSLLVFEGLNVDPLSSLKPPAEVLDLSDPQLAIVTARMDVLHDPDAILTAADSAIQRHPDGRARTFAEMLLNETIGLNEGFPPLALVPVDADLERWARGVLLGPPHPSIDAALRPEAVRALAFFPSDENTRLLTTLLDDPANVTQPAEFNLGLEVRTYPVRAEAYAALREWKVAVAEPVIEEQSSHPEAVRTASLSNHTGMVGHAEIEGLARFDHLERLELRNDHLTAQAYRVIPRLANLRAVSFGGSNITDNKLDALTQLSQLEALDLGATKISDAGLQTIGALPRLRRLNLAQTRVTPAGVEMLRQRRPDVAIQYR